MCFHDPLCPLCLTDVVESQPDSYLVLPVDIGLAADIVDKESPNWKPDDAWIDVGDLRTTRVNPYPSVPYSERCILVHNACREIVGLHLSVCQLRLLIELVEPTFATCPISPAAVYGAFKPPPGRETLRSHTNNKPLMPLLSKLPRELWGVVLTHDIARLLFVMKTAAQLPPPATIRKGMEELPLSRFTQEEVLLRPDRKVGIHLVKIGGQMYVKSLSSIDHPDDNSEEAPLSVISYSLDNACNYLAVKTDGMGVIDVAFRLTSGGDPKWILGSLPHPIHAEVAVIRLPQADGIRRLWMVSDPWKCRAILSLASTGPVPYFKEPFPVPKAAFAMPSPFFTKTDLSERNDPLANFTLGTYVPLTKANNITFERGMGRAGIIKITPNGPARCNDRYFVSLDHGLKSVALILCQNSVFGFQYPFIQIKVENGLWKPPLPCQWDVLHRIEFDNVLGIWHGDRSRSLSVIPWPLGVVVSEESM